MTQLGKSFLPYIIDELKEMLTELRNPYGINNEVKEKLIFLIQELEEDY